MTIVGFPWRRRDAGRSAVTPRGTRTAGQLLARLGRVALWLMVAVLMVRGLAGTLAPDRPAAAPNDSRTVSAAWPDDAARAFAVQLATVYLTHSPTDDPRAYASGLEAFASPELVGELAPRFDADAPRQVVRSALVAGTVRLNGRHALVTVAATLGGAGLARRFITVPIARDGRGGLVVDDLPSFASAPPRATADTPELEPLFGADRAAIVAVLRPFLRAYLAGDGAALTYLVPSGTRVTAAAGRWELVDLTSVSAAGPATRAGRVVLATVQARDNSSRVTYTLRYRVRLVRRDRWYVAAVNRPGRGGERR